MKVNVSCQENEKRKKTMAKNINHIMKIEIKSCIEVNVIRQEDERRKKTMAVYTFASALQTTTLNFEFEFVVYRSNEPYAVRAGPQATTQHGKRAREKKNQQILALDIQENPYHAV
jgi:hypothetical protein